MAQAQRLKWVVLRRNMDGGSEMDSHQVQAILKV